MARPELLGINTLLSHWHDCMWWCPESPRSWRYSAQGKLEVSIHDDSWWLQIPILPSWSLLNLSQRFLIWLRVRHRLRKRNSVANQPMLVPNCAIDPRPSLCTVLSGKSLLSPCIQSICFFSPVGWALICTNYTLIFGKKLSNNNNLISFSYTCQCQIPMPSSRLQNCFEFTFNYVFTALLIHSLKTCGGMSCPISFRRRSLWPVTMFWLHFKGSAEVMPFSKQSVICHLPPTVSFISTSFTFPLLWNKQFYVAREWHNLIINKSNG